MEKKYPIGGYAPGNYQCRCGTCGGGFIGDKQAVQCEPCALEAKARFDALPIEEQMQLIKRNGQIAQVMFECPVSPERDLILRIVEQWGNIIEMPKMEQWLKDYASEKQHRACLPANDAVQNWFENNIGKDCSASSAVYKFRQWLEELQNKQQAAPGWVKASTRLPVPGKVTWRWTDKTEAYSGYKEKGGFIFGTGGASVDPTYYSEIEWLNESESPAEQPVDDNARYELRLALRDMIKLAKAIGCKIADYNEYTQRVEAAEAMLKKHSKVTDVLRTTAPEQPVREMDADRSLFDNLQKWLSDGGYSYDGEYYYDDDNNFFTPDKIWEKFKEQKEK